jgi:hypothetical protein
MGGHAFPSHRRTVQQRATPSSRAIRRSDTPPAAATRAAFLAISVCAARAARAPAKSMPTMRRPSIKLSAMRPRLPPLTCDYAPPALRQQSHGIRCPAAALAARKALPPNAEGLLETRAGRRNISRRCPGTNFPLATLLPPHPLCCNNIGVCRRCQRLCGALGLGESPRSMGGSGFGCDRTRLATLTRPRHVARAC